MGYGIQNAIRTLEGYMISSASNEPLSKKEFKEIARELVKALREVEEVERRLQALDQQRRSSNPFRQS